MTEENPLTKTAITRLKKMAQGNNIALNKIELIETIEKTYQLQATIRLEPTIEVKTKKGFGRPKSKKHKLFGSIDELNKEIEKERTDLTETSAWIDMALKELNSTPGHGWGHQGATLFWDKDKTILTAHDACPTCHGTAQSPCPTCQGVGTVHCTYCEGRQMELCPLCHGAGEDPANPETQCYQCLGQKYIQCRHCHSTGRMPCPQCKGKGNTSCQECRGTGFHSQIAQVKKCATLSFQIGETRKIPSGLLRLMQRVGEDNLHRHAKITMISSSVEAGEDPTQIKLTAHVPYADVKTRLNGKACMFSVFGKNHRMAGVPLFLDAALEEQRTKLAAATKGQTTLNQAIHARLINDALLLILQSKQHPNNLRRLYPLGLSRKVAQEIMSNMDLVIRNMTRQTRLIAGSVFTLLATGFFAALFLTPLYTRITASWNPIVIKGILIVMPIGAMAKCIIVLLYTSRHILQNRFKKAKIGTAQPIGRVGYSFCAAIGLIYLLILYLAGII